MKFVLSVIVALLVWTGIPSSAAASTTTSDCAEPWEAEVVRLINVERKASGIAPLASSDMLGAASEHMVQNFSHYGWTGGHVMNNGTTASENRDNHGYTFNTWQGQNIALGQDSPAEVVAAWMASGDHRDNILSAHYVVIGSGYTKDGAGTRFWAVDFGGAKDAPAERC